MFDLAEHVATFANRPFLVEWPSRREMTYAELLARSRTLAGRLLRDGIGPGDVVLGVLPNDATFPVTALAVLWCGATLAPLDPALSAVALQRIVQRSGARHLLEATGHGLRRYHLPEIAIAAEYPASGPGLPSATSADVPIPLPAHSPVVVLYTSGTSGEPKGVCLGLDAVIANFQEYGRQMGFGSSDRFLQVMPVYHADGWNFSFLLPLLHGSVVVLTRPFDVTVWGQFVGILEHCAPNWLVAVPSILAALVRHGARYAPARLGALEWVICSSEPLQPATKEAFERVYDARVLDLYGLSESQIISYYGKHDTWRPGSVGRLQRGVDARLDKEGELQIRSPYLFSGYLKDPLTTRRSFTADGWFRTGDICTFDDDGFLYLHGRRKDLVKRGGVSVFLGEIDRALLGHPAVTDVATVTLDDEGRGHEIYSFAVGVPEAVVNGEILRQHCCEQLTPARSPRAVFVLDRIPRTSIGKVDGDALRDMARRLVRRQGGVQDG